MHLQLPQQDTGSLIVFKLACLLTLKFILYQSISCVLSVSLVRVCFHHDCLLHESLLARVEVLDNNTDKHVEHEEADKK